MEELTRFFKSIDFEMSADFEDTYIEKVIYNRETKVYNVHLKSKNVIKYEVINQLFSHGKKGINGQDKCFITINYENINDEDVLDYVKNILNAIIFEHPSLMSLENSNIKVVNKKLELEVANKTEENALNNYRRDILTNLENYGLGNFSLEIVINEEKNAEIKREIEQAKEIKIEKKEDNPVIFGFHKDGEVTQIKNIVGEQKNIIIEGYIFGIEESVRKGQKATAYIINLKVSDKTDSFLVKFVRFKEEEYNQILKGIKKNNWYRFV